MDPLPSPRSTDFFVNLYIHNILEATKLADTPVKLSVTSDKSEREKPREIQRKEEKPNYEKGQHTNPMATLWMTAKESLESGENQGPTIRTDNDLNENIETENKQ